MSKKTYMNEVITEENKHSTQLKRLHSEKGACFIYLYTLSLMLGNTILYAKAFNENWYYCILFLTCKTRPLQT